MERDISEEEDEDRENLISSNGESNTMNHSRSTFRIDDVKTRIVGTSRKFNKRYLFAIFLPLTILVIYFTTDLKNMFVARVPVLEDVRGSPLVDRMRSSELRALYLLKKQEFDFLWLWNRTALLNKSYLGDVMNNNSANSTSVHSDNKDIVSSSDFEDFKSLVFSQISLNKKIQEVLLSSHENEAFVDFNENYTDSSSGGWMRCGKVDQRWSERKTIEWKPKSNKYLFALCVSSHISSRLICLEKHMFFAALLNRVLIIPSAKIDHELHRVLEIAHINKCLGGKAVVTFEEFVERKKKLVHIDKFACYFSSPQPCSVDEEHLKKMKGLGISWGKIESVWNEDAMKPSKKMKEDLLAKFSLSDDVITIGDLFFADVENEWIMQPGGPIAHKCKTLMEPNRLILLTAQRFIQTFLGKDFIALHFRRNGFLSICNEKKQSCFYPVPQAADCINKVVEKASTPVIYLSTDAARSEVNLLQSLVEWNGKNVPLVQRPSRDSAEKWDALLYRHGLEDDRLVEAVLDKTICAMSTVFIGSSGSKFTEDILRLRKDWGSASHCDEHLCKGEFPDFIAENA